MCSKPVLFKTKFEGVWTKFEWILKLGRNEFHEFKGELETPTKPEDGLGSKLRRNLKMQAPISFEFAPEFRHTVFYQILYSEDIVMLIENSMF